MNMTGKCSHTHIYMSYTFYKLEDLKVLKRSPESDIQAQDLLNNVTLGHGRPRLIISTYFVRPTSQMIHTKTQQLNDTYQDPRLGLLVPENNIFKVFTIYH